MAFFNIGKREKLMKNQKTTLAILVATAVGLLGCATGEQHRADSYAADQVNTAQEVKPVQILAITPAKVQVDNAEGKKKAQIGGAVVGALLGGAAGGTATSKSGANVAGGAAAGGVIGAAAGSMVDDKILVDGVSIIFKENGKGKKPLTSTQVGRLCEYQIGDAFMFQTKNKETRIQPNNVGGCDKEKK